MPRNEAVIVTRLADVDGIRWDEWPCGFIYVDAVTRLTKERSDNGPVPNWDPPQWQALARAALLRKYGHLDAEAEFDHSTSSDPNAFCQRVTSTWLSLLDDHHDDDDDDLIEFLRTGKSNGRTLRFDLMDCAPGCQFNLHAHPNLELVYCVRGSLHEIRLEGPPFPSSAYLTDQPSDDDDKKRSENGDENNGGGNDDDNDDDDDDLDRKRRPRVRGPNLTNVRRPWKFGSLRPGEWLVNEAGSVHKSFTSTTGDGCVLITLWSGGHADVSDAEHPRDPNLPDAVRTVDAAIGACRCATDWTSIPQTFLPASERR